jgi:hypothetical protein
MENYGMIEFFGKNNISIFLKDIKGKTINKIDLFY